MRILIFKFNEKAVSLGVKGLPPELVAIFLLKAIDIIAASEHETRDINKRDVVIDIKITDTNYTFEEANSLEELVDINVVSSLSQDEAIHILVGLLLSMEMGTFYPMMPF